MNNGLITESLFEFFFGTWLLFVGLLLVIELGMRFFRIPSGRSSALCRSIPFIKLITAGLFSLFVPSDALVNVNVFGCGGLLHSWTPVYIMPDWLEPFYYLLIGLLGIGMIKALDQLRQILLSYQRTQQLCQRAGSLTHTFKTDLLNAYIMKRNILILVSTEIAVPLALGRNKIVLPQPLLQALTGDELEAVIAHEVEHLRWHDALVQVSCKLLSSFFWWVPTKWWLRQMCEDQEVACDTSLERYEMDRLSLADAMIKVLREERREMAACYLLEIYPSRPQNSILDDGKAPGLNDRKSVHISNIDRLAIVQPRELLHHPKSNFEAGWGINQTLFRRMRLNTTGGRQLNKVLLCLFLMIVLCPLLCVGFALC